MADAPRSLDPEPPPRPRWVKVAVIIAVAVIVTVVAVILFAGGEHGPGRHLRGGGAHPASVEGSL